MLGLAEGDSSSAPFSRQLCGGHDLKRLLGLAEGDSSFTPFLQQRCGRDVKRLRAFVDPLTATSSLGLPVVASCNVETLTELPARWCGMVVVPAWLATALACGLGCDAVIIRCLIKLASKPPTVSAPSETAVDVDVASEPLPASLSWQALGKSRHGRQWILCLLVCLAFLMVLARTLRRLCSARWLGPSTRMDPWRSIPHNLVQRRAVQVRQPLVTDEIEMGHIYRVTTAQSDEGDEEEENEK